MSKLRDAVPGLFGDASSIGVQAAPSWSGAIRLCLLLGTTQSFHITTELALQWAMQPSHSQPATWGAAAHLRAVFRSTLDRY